jgi:hypothetical protein
MIDQALGVSDKRNISFGQLFVAMIINGLGFTGRTLHIYSEYHNTGSLYTGLAKRQDALQQLGLFIIASNDLADDLSMEKILSTYKFQQ